MSFCPNNRITIIGSCLARMQGKYTLALASTLASQTSQTMIYKPRTPSCPKPQFLCHESISPEVVVRLDLAKPIEEVNSAGSLGCPRIKVSGFIGIEFSKPFPSPAFVVRMTMHDACGMDYWHVGGRIASPRILQAQLSG